MRCEAAAIARLVLPPSCVPSEHPAPAGVAGVWSERRVAASLRQEYCRGCFAPVLTQRRFLSLRGPKERRMEHHASASSGNKVISGEALTVFGAERVCKLPQCATRLSQYNPDPLCSQHRGWGQSVAPRPRHRPVEGANSSVGWIDWIFGKRPNDAQ